MENRIDEDQYCQECGEITHLRPKFRHELRLCLDCHKAREQVVDLTYQVKMLNEWRDNTWLNNTLS